MACSTVAGGSWQAERCAERCVLYHPLVLQTGGGEVRSGVPKAEGGRGSGKWYGTVVWYGRFDLSTGGRSGPEQEVAASLATIHKNTLLEENAVEVVDEEEALAEGRSGTMYRTITALRPSG